MNRPVPRRTVVGAIIRKDVGEYARDRLWLFLTVMVLVIVIALFWVLPADVDETITVGVTGLDAQVLEGAGAAEEGLAVVPFASESELRAVVEGEATAWPVDGGTATVVPSGSGEEPAGAEQAEVAIGLAFPEDFAATVAGSEPPAATVYVDAGVPEEIRTAMTSLVREIAFLLVGQDLPVDTSAVQGDVVVLGDDRAGAQVSARESFRPVLVFLVLIMELFVMASLIAKEIQDRTVTAVLVTPATTGDILAAKGITGALSGFAQVVVVLVAIDALWPQPLLVLVLMLLGSVMVAGTAMIAGSTGRDFITTLFYGMAYMIPLIIPAFAALFPGTASAWIRALPSYPLVRGLVEVTTYGAGWTDILPQLAALLAWCVALFALGWLVLRRRVESL